MPKLATLKPRVTATTTPPLAQFTDTERIRGTTLQNIRKAHFVRFPLCIPCLAKSPPVTSLAVELDHTVPLHLGGKDTRDPFENRVGMCSECHLAKSKTERGHEYKERVMIGEDGYPVK